MKGFFVTFEGPDGAGKTTQIELLCRWLQEKGFDVLRTREPGGTKISDTIRAILLDPQNIEMTPRTEALLYMASRAQHTDEFIRPALARGCVVVSDRYSDSTLAYQGIARGLPVETLTALNSFATSGLTPDLTVVLDGDTWELVARMAGRGEKDRMDSETDQFHRRVREGFLQLANQEPQRFRVVDATAAVDVVHETIKSEISVYLKQRGL